MPFRSMEQGISAIQQGNHAEGARLLKIALKNKQLTGAMRATALLWLAETKTSVQEKIELHREALQADPGNQVIQQRLSQYLSADLPPMPGGVAPPPQSMPGGQQFATQTVPQMAPQTMPTQQGPPTGFHRTAGILGGPNGPATGFFVTRDGLIATTRYAVGGEQTLNIALDNSGTVTGYVIRAFPEIDVALLHTGLTVNHLLPVSPQPNVPDDAAITSVAHGGRVSNGKKRSTRSAVRTGWFPTTITRSVDAGGAPVFDERNFLVGMLTHNANRTSPHLFAVHVQTIYRCVEQAVQEMGDGSGRVYCVGCGYASRAGALGGFYCEICGSVLPRAQQANRFPTPSPQVEALYGENLQRPCRHCHSRVGYYDGRCLRCGGDL